MNYNINFKFFYKLIIIISNKYYLLIRLYILYNYNLFPLLYMLYNKILPILIQNNKIIKKHSKI